MREMHGKAGNTLIFRKEKISFNNNCLLSFTTFHFIELERRSYDGAMYCGFCNNRPCGL